MKPSRPGYWIQSGYGSSWAREFSSYSKERTLAKFIALANSESSPPYRTLRLVRVTENAKTVEKLGENFIISSPGRAWPHWLNSD